MLGDAAFGEPLHGPLLGGEPDGTLWPLVLFADDPGCTAAPEPARKVCDTFLSAVSVAHAKPGKESRPSGKATLPIGPGLVPAAFDVAGAAGLCGKFCAASCETVLPPAFASAVAVAVLEREKRGTILAGPTSLGTSGKDDAGVGGARALGQASPCAAGEEFSCAVKEAESSTLPGDARFAAAVGEPAGCSGAASGSAGVDDAGAVDLVADESEDAPCAGLPHEEGAETSAGRLDASAIVHGLGELSSGSECKEGGVGPGTGVFPEIVAFAVTGFKKVAIAPPSKTDAAAETGFVAAATTTGGNGVLVGSATFEGMDAWLFDPATGSAAFPRAARGFAATPGVDAAEAEAPAAGCGVDACAAASVAANPPPNPRCGELENPAPAAEGGAAVEISFPRLVRTLTAIASEFAGGPLPSCIPRPSSGRGRREPAGKR